MKIRFLKGFKPKGDASDIPAYEAGKSYSFDGMVAEGYARKYIRLGIAEQVGQPQQASLDLARAEQAERERAEAERKAQEAARLAARGAEAIPDDLDRLTWPELRGLASKLTDEAVHNKQDAIKAIESEKGRRAVIAA